MSFPNPPAPGQVYDHPNGLQYVFDDSTKTWDLVYATGTNTGSLPLINPTSFTLPTSLPEVPPGLVVQADYNAWVFDALKHVNKESNIEVEAAPGPTDPDDGRLWYNSDSGKLYLYYNDGSSSQWVEIVGDGGGGGEESEAFIRWHQFAVIERSSRFDYDPIFETNANSTDNAWQYQMDVQGDGTWEEVSSMDPDVLNDIGWYGSMSVSHLRLNKTDEQANYPNAKIRFYVTSTMNGVTNEDWSCDLPAWTAGQCEYNSAVSELAERVAEGEAIQEEVLSSIQNIQIQAGLHQLNIDNINADQITQNEDIDSIQAEQVVQNNQINALETQIQLLAKASGGVWSYERNISGTSPRPPDNATFYGTHTAGVDTVLTNWSDINLLMVDKTDANGTEFVFTNFEVGDKIEIIATDASSVCIGTIAVAATQDSYGNMIVDPDRTNGGPEEGKQYLISVYRPGEEDSGIDTDVLDNRYLIRSGDEMNSGAYLSLPSGGIKMHGSSDAKKSSFYNANDQITQWTAYNGTSIKITARDGDPGSGRTYIDIRTTDSSGEAGTDDGYRMRLYHVASPTSDLHAANKKYVDEAVSSLGIAQARWTQKGSSYDVNAFVAGDIKSRISGSGTNWTWELYIANKALINGQEVYWHGENTHYPSATNGTEYTEDLAGQIVSLFEVPSVGTPYMFATGRIKSGYPQFNKGSANYCYIQCDHVRSRGFSPSTSPGACIITLSPWLPIIY